MHQNNRTFPWCTMCFPPSLSFWIQQANLADWTTFFGIRKEQVLKNQRMTWGKTHKLKWPNLLFTTVICRRYPFCIWARVHECRVGGLDIVSCRAGWRVLVEAARPPSFGEVEVVLRGRSFQSFAEVSTRRRRSWKVKSQNWRPFFDLLSFTFWEWMLRSVKLSSSSVLSRYKKWIRDIIISTYVLNSLQNDKITQTCWNTSKAQKTTEDITLFWNDPSRSLPAYDTDVCSTVTRKNAL